MKNYVHKISSMAINPLNSHKNPKFPARQLAVQRLQPWQQGRWDPKSMGDPQELVDFIWKNPMKMG